MTNEEVSRMLWDMIPKEEVERAFLSGCDLDGSFAGFVDVYYELSKVIPKHWTVVDIGCAYNAQSYLFKDHKRYIAVDPSDCEKFKAPNCEIFNMTAKEFLHTMAFDGLNLDETFAICSYVPNWHNQAPRELTRLYFKTVFTYYPHGVQETIL